MNPLGSPWITGFSQIMHSTSKVKDIYLRLFAEVLRLVRVLGFLSRLADLSRSGREEGGVGGLAERSSTKDSLGSEALLSLSVLSGLSVALVREKVSTWGKYLSQIAHRSNFFVKLTFTWRRVRKLF